MPDRPLRLAGPVRRRRPRVGLISAAALLAGWQLSRPAVAEPINPGSSESSFFGVEWKYDFRAGTGLVYLVPNDSSFNVFLNRIDFWTLGVAFDRILLDGNPTAFESAPDRSGALIQYSLVTVPSVSLPARIDVTFPRIDIGLYSTPLRYSRSVSSDGLRAPLGPATMNFVSIQAIPENSTLALLATGALIASIFRRRRESRSADQPVADSGDRSLHHVQ